MANRSTHILLIILVGMAMLIGIVAWTIFSTRDNLSTNTLEDAVRIATYESRDNSARANRSVFVINKTKFQNLMENAHIKELDGKKYSDSEFTISYLEDSNANGKMSSQNISTLKSQNEAPIKAVRVVANIKQGGNATSSSANKHVVTQVIQTNGQSNDEPNDLTEE